MRRTDCRDLSQGLLISWALKLQKSLLESPQELITCPGPLQKSWALSLGESILVRKPCVLWSFILISACPCAS